MTNAINQEITVTGYYFTSGKAFPCRVQLGNEELTFVQSGLRCLVQKGQELIEVFNMSDGHSTYTIRHEELTSQWTLLSKRALA